MIFGILKDIKEEALLEQLRARYENMLDELIEIWTFKKD